MATLNPEQLLRALERRLAPVYLVSGDEPLLRQEACDAIRSAARTAGFSERELYHVDAHFDWNLLLDAVSSLSLFADRKLIEIRIDNGKIDEQGARALLEYCQRPPDDTLLLIVTPRMKNVQRSKWHQALLECGELVQVWPVTPQQLPGWLERRLRLAGLRADSGTIELLAARTEGNLLAAAQEVEKLKLLSEDGLVSADLIAGAVADSARYDVFSLVDKCLHGDARAAVRTLHGLRGEGTEATVILWALAREIRTLARLADDLDAGQNFDRLARSLGVWDKRKPLVKQALQRLSAGKLKLLLRRANRIDNAIKGLRSGAVWDELLDLTLNLAGSYSLSPEIQKLSLTLDN